MFQYDVQYIKQSGPVGKFALINIQFEPASTTTFHNTSSLLPEYVAAVEEGVRSVQIPNCKITLTGGREHIVDSSGRAFRTAGQMAAKSFLLGRPSGIVKDLI